MSQISLKSISGITSITTPTGVDNQLTLHTNDTTQRVKVTQSGIEVVGVATFQDIDVDGHTNLDNISVAGVSTFTGNIKQTAPGTNTAKITLNNASDTTGMDVGYSESSGVGFINVGQSGSGLSIKTGGTAAGNERLRINSNGTIGINTTADTRQLEIFNSSHATAALKSDTQSSLFFSDSADTNIGQISYMHSGSPNNYMYFRVNDQERLRIESNGDVEWNNIGTPTPGYNNSTEGMGFEPRNGTIFLSRADNLLIHANRNNEIYNYDFS